MQDAKERYRIEIISDCKSMSPERNKELTDAFIRLGWRSTGGEDWESFVPAREGWDRYFRMEGTRPRDYARLTLIYDGDELVHMSGASVADIAARDSVIWFRVTHTHPDHRRSGLMSRGTTALLYDWIEDLGRERTGVWLVFRTPNPVVYEAVRAVVLSPYRPRGVAYLRLYPWIDDAGELEPVSDAIRALAERSMAVTASAFRFDPTHFVLEGAFEAQYHVPVFADVTFPCESGGSRLYFDRVLDRKRQDGLVALVRFVLQPRAAG